MLLLNTIIAAVSLLGGGAQSAQNPELQLGKYMIAGEEVQAVLPSSAGSIPSTAPHFESGGWSYLLDNRGQIIDRYKADGGWSEVRLLFDEAKRVQEKLPWRVKVVVFMRQDTLEKTPDGVLRLHRLTVPARQRANITQAIARFASMAEAYSGGQLNVVLDVGFEEDWMAFGLGGNQVPFGSAFAESYFSPRINSGEYKVEDRVYRGPYQSVLYLYPSAQQGYATEVNGTPVSGVSMAGNESYESDLSHLSWDLLAAWEQQVLVNARERGYLLSMVRAKPRHIAMSITPAMWRNIAGPVPSQDTFLGRLQRDKAAPSAWAPVADDPYAGLRALEWPGVAALAGSEPADYVRLQQGAQTGPGATAAGQVLIARPWATELFATQMSGASQLKPVGFTDLEGSTVVAFWGPAKASPPLNTLQLSGLTVNVEPAGERIKLSSLEASIESVWTVDGKPIDFSEGSVPAKGVPNIAIVSATLGGVKVSRPIVLVNDDPLLTPPVAEAGTVGESGLAAGAIHTSGGLKASMVTDPERGSVLQVNEEGMFRKGSVRLIGRAFSIATHPYLEFWIKTRNIEPLQLTFHGADRGKSRVRGASRLLLFSYLPGDEAKMLGLSPATWQKVSIDLRQLPLMPEMISQITLDAPLEAARNERQTFGATVWLDDVRVTGTLDGAVTPLLDPQPKKPSATSADRDERSLFAAEAGADQVDALLTLMKDPDHLVKVNAAAAFQRIKDPRAVPALSDATRSPVRRMSEAALKALAFQDSEASWAAIRQALNHYEDDVREMATGLLATRKDPMLAGPFALLYAARSWQTRAAAARGIGMLPGDEAQAILLAFANEIDPAGRAAFISAANPSKPNMTERIAWLIVNDPSDYVRATAAIKAIASEDNSLRLEGFKALKDDSRVTRTMILEFLEDKPREDARSGIVAALSDPSYVVRVAALGAYGALNRVTTEELAPVLKEKDPRVQRELIRLSKKKGLKLPAETIEVLRSSVDPGVVQLAKEL